MEIIDPYQLDNGIWCPPTPVVHQEENYDSSAFDLLFRMEQRHFWYQGRYRFLWAAFRRYLRDLLKKNGPVGMIDIGGGCGGWMERLARRLPQADFELALGDSSLRALEFAENVLPPWVKRYHLDCRNLLWENRWDVIFCLDVLEHFDDDLHVLVELGKACTPSGLVFITVPALAIFWSHYDTLALHRRRYHKKQLIQLACQAGLHVCDVRYFMFLLSPLVLLRRWLFRNRQNPESSSASTNPLARWHQTPLGPLNLLLRAIFSAETPLGLWIPFPWGASLLGIFRKPSAGQETPYLSSDTNPHGKS
jgi:trans-aconitate methyltransferase